MTASNPSAIDVSTLTGTWTLVPDQTSIEFHTKAVWVVKVKGTFKALEGSGTVAADGGVSGTIVVDAASVNTKNKKRDDHLRTADFFEVATYPTLEFVVSDAQLSEAGQVLIPGSLTIHGVTKPVTFAADLSVSGDAATVSAEVDIDRSAWGLTWAKMGAGLANHVVIKAHFVKN
ncbi:MAG TPA: YceI family protein [Acidimicrobiales bacterium]|jgi:polyisoprenoid-binding protein YceI|nr:YceI family protein [Acidimicrobiales bacterium]